MEGRLCIRNAHAVQRVVLPEMLGPYFKARTAQCCGLWGDEGAFGADDDTDELWFGAFCCSFGRS